MTKLIESVYYLEAALALSSAFSIFNWTNFKAYSLHGRFVSDLMLWLRLHSGHTTISPWRWIFYPIGKQVIINETNNNKTHIYLKTLETKCVYARKVQRSFFHLVKITQTDDAIGQTVVLFFPFTARHYLVELGSKQKKSRETSKSAVRHCL